MNANETIFTPKFKIDDQVLVASNCVKFLDTDGNRVFYQSMGKGTIVSITMIHSNKYTLPYSKYRVEFKCMDGTNVFDEFLEQEIHLLRHKDTQVEPNQGFTPLPGNYDLREVAKTLRADCMKVCNSACTSQNYDIAASRIALADMVESFYNPKSPEQQVKDICAKLNIPYRIFGFPRIETSDLKALGFKLSEGSDSSRYYGKVPNTSRNIYVEPLFDGYVKVSYGDMIKDTNDIQIIKDLIKFLHTFNDTPTPP